MFQVWRINKTPAKTDSHATNRSENWSWSRDKSFLMEKEAEAYVIKQNYIHCGYELHIRLATPETVRRRCITDPSFSYLRKYFLQRPNEEFSKNEIRDLIVSQLRENHIQVS